MKKEYIKILEKIEENGYLSYVVGGYVRDKLLNKDTADIDIITNATPKDLKRIFSNIDNEYTSYGAVKLKVKDHLVDITTFRRELSYTNGKPSKIEYTPSLEEDLKRRDFTINTLVMDKDSNIIDLLGAKKDLEKGLIKCVKDTSISLREDPSRILRAIRFMCILDMDLDKEIEDFIKNNKELIREIPLNKRKEELNKLFRISNYNRFISFIKKYDLEEYLGIRVDNIKKCSFTIGVWSQIELIDKYNFTKIEKEQIKEIKSLLSKGFIDKIDVYKKGLFICQAASEILGINKKQITNTYNLLPIKNVKDIDITPSEICSIFNITPSKRLGNIISRLEKDIINNKVNNNKEDIIKYLKEW